MAGLRAILTTLSAVFLWQPVLPAANPSSDARPAVAVSSACASPRDKPRTRRPGRKDGTNGKKRAERKQSADKRKRARQAIQDGHLDRADRMVKDGLAKSRGAEKSAWRVVQAELQHARRQYDRAGLTAMRVVILEPDCPSVGAALYWAGRAYEGLKRPGKAKDLYEECISHDSTTRSIRRKAEKRLGRLDNK